MNKLITTLSIISAIILVSSCGNGNLPRAAKNELPCDVSTFDHIFEDVRANGTEELDGLMVLKEGKVIYEKYNYGFGKDVKHALWSASKTFTSAAIGFAKQDGLLDENDPILKFFDEDEMPSTPSDWLKSMTIKNLLTMSSGFAHDSPEATWRNGGKDWVKVALSDSLTFEPGTRFAYNSMNTYLLSVIVSKVTGKKLADYLTEKLFKPLQITDWVWEESPQGYNCGGWGLYLRLEDLAKMGQFYLQKGKWNGKQLLDPEWIEASMSAQIYQQDRTNATPEQIEKWDNSDWGCGYGYQMWRCIKPSSARLDGAHAQLCIICPDKNLVVATLSHANSGTIMAGVWKYIYDSL